MANGIMDFNKLGIALIDDEIPKKVTEEIEEKMIEIIDKARDELDEYLETLGLESVMGVIIKKNP